MQNKRINAGDYVDILDIKICSSLLGTTKASEPSFHKYWHDSHRGVFYLLLLRLPKTNFCDAKTAHPSYTMKPMNLRTLSDHLDATFKSITDAACEYFGFESGLYEKRSEERRIYLHYEHSGKERNLSSRFIVCAHEAEVDRVKKIPRKVHSERLGHT